MLLSLVSLISAMLSFASLAAPMQNTALFSDVPPAGAPTVACTVEPVRDASKLLVLAGSNPMTSVFACGLNRSAGKCAVMTAAPGSRDLSRTARFTPSGVEQNGWSCVSSDSVNQWIPTDRLAPLPPAPAVTTEEWLGWWREGKDSQGVRNNRLLITRSETQPRTLHVSGRAYWYGLYDNVHSGGVNADASAYGDTLHIVDGNDAYACVLDLVYHSADHTFTASDNANCGGMNVRFMGEWRRFTPSTPKPRSQHSKG